MDEHGSTGGRVPEAARTRAGAGRSRRSRRRAVVGALVAALAVAGLAVQVPGWAADEEPLSQGCAVTASSKESAQFGPEQALDGDGGTRWASAEGSDPQWLKVDLGRVDTIDGLWLSWEAAYASEYKIQVSDDGDTWRTVYSTTSGRGGQVSVDVDTTGRYVLLYGTRRGTPYGYSLYEFEVFGDDGTATAPSSSAPDGGSSPAQGGGDLADARHKEIAMELVASAENSTLDWKSQYGYIDDIDDGRGYTAGIIGFTTGTGDLLELVQRYTDQVPGNPLAKYLPALERVNGGDSHDGLGSGFEAAWKSAAATSAFRQAQDAERDRVYFDPAVARAKQDGLGILGQFAYYDAMVMHGPGDDEAGFETIRNGAVAAARTPAQGGDERTYLRAFLTARERAMELEEAHSDLSRAKAQRGFLEAGNLNLDPPLRWTMYEDSFEILS